MTTKPKKLELRLPPALHAAVKRQAVAQGRSMNGQIVHTLKKATKGEPVEEPTYVQQVGRVDRTKPLAGSPWHT